MDMSSSGKGKETKSYFDVVGLCCSSEVPLIEKILVPLEGVKQISVIVPSRTVIVVHDELLISQTQIVKVLNGARLEANVRVYGKGSMGKRWPSPYAQGCGVLWLVSLFKFWYHPLQWVALGAVALGIIPISLKGVAAFRNFRIDINVLVLIAVIGTIALKDYVEAATIVFLFSIAEWLESMASHKATAVMSSLMNLAPQKAVVADTGELVDVEDVKVNTLLAVKAGEVIPIDGVVVQGNCEVDEKTLTGESFPVAKQLGSSVWAGTINLNGYVSVRTTVLAEDCVVSRMAKLVEEAQNRKCRTQRLIDDCAKYYTPAIVLISAGVAGIPAAMGVQDRNRWFRMALVVLVSACPCALILSTPVATFCALSKAATTGLLIKGGDYLETLSKIKMVAFDKTGTVTRGEFEVTSFHSLSEDVNLNTLLYWVSSIESKSSHPMAAALVDYGRIHSTEPKPENVEEFHNYPGEGIHGMIDGKNIYVGNKKISIRAGCQTARSSGTDTMGGSTMSNVYLDGTCVGFFSLSDVCRSGVAEAIKDLKSLGIRSSMLTGDNHAAAKQIQHQLGNALDRVHADLLPEDKAEIIKGFQKEGRTAMVGDGLNDALALATADIGISMGISGSALATDTGHVILMSNDIRKIPEAVKLARKCRWKVIENVILSFLTKATVIALACAGHPLVSVAVLADVGTCLLVIFNSSMLLLGGGKGGHKHRSHGGKGCDPHNDHSCHTHDHHHHSQSETSTDADHQENKSQASHDHDHHCHHHGPSELSIARHEKASNTCGQPPRRPSSSIGGSCGQKKCSQRKSQPTHCIDIGKFHPTTCAHDDPPPPPPEDRDGHLERQLCENIHQTPCHRETKHDGHGECKQKAEMSRAQLRDHIDHVELGKVLQACMSLEKREKGGCCKSYREVCCKKHGHGHGHGHNNSSGSGFGGGGGLTEIITE